MLNVLDIFSGIGGFSLGLERTGGFRTVAFCEIDPFCRKVLAKHWPDVPCYEDVRELTAARLAADGIAVDVIAGGFPCQDVSLAGKRAGLEGERSGLWSEYRRLLGELRPRFAIIENVPGLLSRGMATVLGDIAEVGFDAVWDSIPASAVGAPHRRDRVWIVAYSGSERGRLEPGRRNGSRRADQAVVEHDGTARPMADTTVNGRHARWTGDAPQEPGRRQPYRGGVGFDVAHADGSDEYRRGGSLQVGWCGLAGEASQDGVAPGIQWSSEPAVGRVAHGVSNRVDQLSALGNAVVPQIPEMIGRAILQVA